MEFGMFLFILCVKKEYTLCEYADNLICMLRTRKQKTQYGIFSIIFDHKSKKACYFNDDWHEVRNGENFIFIYQANR